MLPSIDTGQLIIDSLRFAPELLLCGGIVLLLFLRLFRVFDGTHLGRLALLFALLALGASVLQWLGLYGMEPPAADAAKFLFGDVRSGLLVYDYFTVFVRF